MPTDEVLPALEILKRYASCPPSPAGYKPQIIFHGAEPTLNWEALLAAFDRYGDDFRFGVQTNGTVAERCPVRQYACSEAWRSACRWIVQWTKS